MKRRLSAYLTASSLFTVAFLLGGGSWAQEQQQESSGGMGSVLIRSRPDECLIDIPDLGISGSEKKMAEWRADNVPVGEYRISFRGEQGTLSASFKLTRDSTVLIEADFGRESVHVSAAPRGFVFLREETFSCGGVEKEMRIYLHEKTDLEFVHVPGGSFLMGSPEDELKRNPDEGPRRRVKLHDFMLCRTEVTKAVWDRIGGEDSRKWKAPDLPMENVSWFDVTEWCDKAGLRLPSEAEWEYACRAGTSTLHHCGTSDESLAEYAWFDQDAAIAAPPNPVGKKKPNAFGLYDMHGNVFEWCRDWYHESYEGAPADGSAREDESTNRVYRGGVWVRPAHYCRSARRFKCEPKTRHYMLGFRPAADVPEELRLEAPKEGSAEDGEQDRQD